jgi:hypothetical protein
MFGRERLACVRRNVHSFPAHRFVEVLSDFGECRIIFECEFFFHTHSSLRDNGAVKLRVGSTMA